MLVHTQNAKVIWIACFSRAFVGELLARFTKLSSVKMYPKGLDKLGNIVAEANVSQFSRAGNICCGNKFCCSKIRKYFCLRSKTFVSRTQILLPKRTCMFFQFTQSRTQSPQALWPAVGRQKRLWRTGILLPQDLCHKTMQAVTRQPIKKFK